MREIITTGKTVEEALEKALAQLGLTEDDVTVEVLQLPQKKFFKRIPAQVKVTVDGEEEVVAAKEPVKAAAKEEPKKAPMQAPRHDKIEKQEKKAEVSAEKAPKAEKTEKPKPQIKEEQITLRTQEPEMPISSEEAAKLESAIEYLKQICTNMGVVDVKITPVKQGEAVVLKVDGEGSGNLIGHRGETMESLSYLTSLVANRQGGDYMKLGLDINNYRQKRETNLIALAKRIAEKVEKTGRSQTLEPMNPYERRIIHSAVSEVEGVKSESTGEGANRRVCIVCTGAHAKTERNFRKNNNRQRPQNGQKKPYANRNNNFERKSNVPEREFADKVRDTNATPVAPKRTQTVNDGESVPLYGKIEF